MSPTTIFSAVLLSGLITAPIAYYSGQRSMQTKMHRLELTHAAQIQAQQALALKTYADLEATKDDAIRKAQDQAKRSAAAASDARAASERLRVELAGVPTRFDAASRAALDEYAATAGELLSECSQAYRDMAQAADGHALDAALIFEAWPRR